MAAFIDTEYADAFLSTPFRTALFTDDDAVGFDQTKFDLIAEAATAKVRSRLCEAGYTPPDTLDTVSAYGQHLIKLATFEVFKRYAYHRKQLEVPANPTDFKAIADELGSGDADPEGMAPTVSEAVGGLSFSDSTGTLANSRPQLFPRGAR